MCVSETWLVIMEDRIDVTELLGHIYGISYNYKDCVENTEIRRQMGVK